MLISSPQKASAACSGRGGAIPTAAMQEDPAPAAPPGGFGGGPKHRGCGTGVVSAERDFGVQQGKAGLCVLGGSALVAGVLLHWGGRGGSGRGSKPRRARR